MERRTQLGLTQIDVVTRPGVSRAYISIENAERPRVAGEILVRVACALETTCDYVWGLTDDPRPRAETGPELDPLDLEVPEIWRLFTADRQRHIMLQQMRLLAELAGHVFAEGGNDGQTLAEIRA